MKVNSSTLAGRGKIGQVVFYQKGGATIARQYRDKIANPRTDAQVASRSKLKLMSQLAAAFAPVIVIPKDGLKSPRNLFMKRNSEAFHATAEGASVDYTMLQLTNGSVPLPSFSVSKDEASYTCALDSSGRAVASRVVYIVYQIVNEKLVYVTSAIQEDEDGDGLFTREIHLEGSDYIFFAYGIKDATSAATSTYAAYKAATASDVATLYSRRKLSAANYTFTSTQCSKYEVSIVFRLLNPWDDIDVLFEGQSKKITPLPFVYTADIQIPASSYKDGMAVSFYPDLDFSHRYLLEKDQFSDYYKLPSNLSGILSLPIRVYDNEGNVITTIVHNGDFHNYWGDDATLYLENNVGEGEDIFLNDTEPPFKSVLNNVNYAKLSSLILDYGLIEKTDFFLLGSNGIYADFNEVEFTEYEIGDISGPLEFPIYLSIFPNPNQPYLLKIDSYEQDS